MPPNRPDMLFRRLWKAVRRLRHVFITFGLLVLALPAFAQSATTTSLTSSLNPSTAGASTTLTATVVGTNPTGTVQFKDGAANLGSTVPLTGTGNTRAATLNLSTLTGGNHSLTAVYGGDINNAQSTSNAVAQTVNVAASTTVVSSSLNPSTGNASVTFTATVTGFAPAGTVQFYDGTVALGSPATLSGTGNTRTATYVTSVLVSGAHSIKATYTGDVSNSASTSATVVQTVNAAASATALASSVNPSTASGSTTLTATVTGAGPTGTMSFRDGAASLGAPVALTGTGNTRTAALATAALAGGSHALTAAYGGDAYNATSTSAVLTQTVNKRTTTTVLSSSANPASFGTSVTITATITGFSPGGTVTFKDGASTLGNGAVLNGTASFTSLGLTTGAHSFTAVYSGDTSNLTSTSATFTQTINAAALPAMKWLYGYDPLGRSTQAVDPNQQSTAGSYDLLGRLVQKQEPANVGTSSPTITAYAYNAADDLTQVTDPRSLATTYAPNGLGDVKTQTSPDSGTTQFTYDANGNVLTRTDARGKTTRYTYDALDRPTLIDYPTGVDTTLQYDGGATPVQGSIGQLTKVTDESGQTVWAYNTLGQLGTKTQTTSSKVFAVGYGWGSTGGALDKLASITYPGGSRVNYAYDIYGRVSGITVNPVNTNGVGVNTGSTLTLLSTVAYTAENKVKAWSWSDASTRSISYDGFGQVSAYSLGKPNGSGIAAGSQRTVVRDNAGQVTGYTHTINGVSAPSLNQTFAYDNLGRLLSVTLGGVVTQYSYDATGNRSTKVVAGTTYTNTVAATSNRMTATQDVGGSFTVIHDSAGNITADGTNTFVYSDRGRMSTATAAGNTVSYLFSALDQRVAKTGPVAAVPTGAAYYVYGEDGQLLGEYDATQAPLYETIYLGSTPVGVMKRTGTAAGNNLAVTVSNVFSDHIDTPRVITRQSDQAIVWRWDSAESFGNSAPNQNPNALGTFAFNQRFPGQVFDAESGLAQNWFREYAARTGRFVQSDPIGLEGGINAYTYVEGNPVSYIDSTGEIAFIPVVIGIGVGYAFDYALERYKKEHCTCKDTPAGSAGNAAAGGAVGGSGPFANKPRGGIAGGGPSGTATSTFSQMNHAAASRGWYSIATRNGITKVLRNLPYAGSVLAAYELYDAFSCD